MLMLLGNAVYLFIAIVFRSTLAAPDMVLSMGQIELFDIYIECKQITYPRLNC